MLGRITGTVRFTEPLSFYTSLRIGGPAEFFVMPQDVNDVRYALAFAEQEDLPVVVIGGGNNMLISDSGLQAVVLKLEGILGRAEFNGDEVAVGAGMPLSALIREAAALGLGGLEHLAGIPATVGGALATHARSLEGSLLDVFSSITFLYPDGTIGEHRPSGPAGAGRSLDLPAGAVVVGGRLHLVRRPAQRIQENLRLRMKTWKDTQPFALASAGYVWKNPTGDRAARLIEAVGLRGKRVRGAEISSKSGNLMINRGGATHADVLALMEMARERVESRMGITLQPEIRLLGPGVATAFETQTLELSGTR
ncbi:MAG TPA: FAD-binding protein [Candidatus Acidoferrales bacterium]|jgi:UDP-N-acetylmuramate dehydrogenase|nr:FAD-binding protein [Candidatus Acidoferrales bacterium]